MTATLKSKQTLIATVRNHLRILASFPTLLIFHWSLPLRLVVFVSQVQRFYIQITEQTGWGRGEMRGLPPL
jgi:hypothetical protein